MNIAKIPDHEGLARDLHTNAVINTNIQAFEEFRARRLEQKSVESRIENLERSLLKIEQMLQKIVSNTTEE